LFLANTPLRAFNRMEKILELNEKYCDLQKRKIWLREEIKKADREQDQIKREIDLLSYENT